ncbi:MAG TPA: secretin N-terminal domain-containing protein [Fimbriimonadaceae bacterium]|nr:secretin N-terminal domain-containing protein [Fimbriimonadaceae bacterium]
MRSLLVGAAMLPSLVFAQELIGLEDAHPWTSFKLNPKTRIALNFHGASVDAVIDLISKTSGVTIVKDPSLVGAITVTSAKPVSLNDAFQILATTLSLKGYNMSKQGNLLVIKGQSQQNSRGNGSPFGNIPPDQLSQMFGGGNPQTELRVFPITYANASQLAKVVNDVFAPNGQQQNPFQLMFQGGGGRNNPFNRGNNRLTFGGANNGQQPSVRASSDDFSNSVIVNAPSSMMEQVSDIIKKLDKQSDDPQSAQVYHLTYATASQLAPTVQNVLTANAPKGRGGIGGQNVDFGQRIQQAFRFGTTQAAFGTVVADDRTNSLVVTATPENQILVKKVIDDLDQEVPIQNTTFVFPLSNARATDVATLMQQAFGTRTGLTNNRPTNQTQTNQRQNVPTRSGGGGSGGSSRPPGLGGEVTPDGNSLDIPVDPDGDLMTSVSVAQGGGFGQIFRGGGGGFGQGNQNQNTIGRDAQGRPVNIRDLQNQITVIPDPNTNSLIVVTTPDNVQLVQNILDQLDRIPPQVMIETKIIETSLDKSSQFGVEWKFAQTKAFGNKGTSGSLSNDFGLANADPALQGFKYTLSGGDLGIFLNALQNDTKFQVLSTPRIFTSNNSQAQINISQSIPYVLSTTTDVNTGSQSFNYAFEDVGIILTVTPHITSNGYVTMDVDQTANDLQGYTSFNAPIVNQRTASTTVSVKDGDTIILGGIIRNNVTSTVKKIPLLGDIPLLGQLFRSTSKDNQKTELMVFLTPRVIRNPDEAQNLREKEIKEMSPEGQKTIKNAIPPSIGDGHKSPPPPGS